MTSLTPAPDPSVIETTQDGPAVSAAQPGRRDVPSLAEALALPGAQELLETALAVRFGRRDGRVDVTTSAGLGVGVRTV